MNKFEPQAQQLLRTSEQDISSDDLQSLRDIRSQAINQPLKRHWPSFLAPAAGMATASLLAVVLIFNPVTESPEETFTATESAEFYEDLDFYSWLATQDDING